MNAGVQNIMISLGAMQRMFNHLFLFEQAVNIALFCISCPQDPIRRPGRSQLCPAWLCSQSGRHHWYILLSLLQGPLSLAFSLD